MLEVGIKQEYEKIVTENDTADKAASGTLKVFATPVMIAWMEEASHTLVQKYLDSSESTVGTEVNIRHLKGSLVGVTLKVVSELIEIDRKKLVFKVAVFENDQLVGDGVHTRFIINKEKFLAKLNG